jgi:hypothetical protein
MSCSTWKQQKGIQEPRKYAFEEPENKDIK